MDSPDPNLPDAENELSTDPSIKKKQKSCIHKNRMAINALFIAFRKRPSLLQLVLNTSSLKWPNGRAWVAMKKLELKFNPQDNVTMLDAEKAIDDAKMKTGESPTDFHDRLCSIQRRYPNQLNDHSIRNAMMRKSSPQYRDVIIQSLKKPDLSADELMEDMQHVYRTLQSLNFEDAGQDETEVALVQPTNRTRPGPCRSTNDYQSTMRCFICNQVGHKMQDCPMKHLRNTIRCVHCGRTGHTHNRCWSLPENAANRPEWYSPPSVANAGATQAVTPAPQEQEDEPDVGLTAYDYAFISVTNDEKFDYDSASEGEDSDSGSQIIVAMIETADVREGSDVADSNATEMKEAESYVNESKNDDEVSFPSAHNSDEMEQVMQDIAFGAGASDWSDEEYLDEDDSFNTVMQTTSSDEYNLGSDYDDEDEMLVQLQDDDEEKLIQLQDDQTVKEATSNENEADQLVHSTVPECIDLTDLASDSNDYSVQWIKTVQYPDHPTSTPTMTASSAVEQPHTTIDHSWWKVLTCEDPELGEGESLISPIDRQRALIHYRLEEIMTEAAYNAQCAAGDHMADTDLESNGSFEPALITVIPFMAPNLIERVDMNLIESNPDEERLLFAFHAISDNSSPAEQQDEDRQGLSERHSDHDNALIVAAFERAASDRLYVPHIFVLDSGASATSSPHLQGVVRTRQLSNREILAFDGHPMAIEHRYDM